MLDTASITNTTSSSRVVSEPLEITHRAQEKLSDVTLVELPHVGEQVKGGAVGVVESVKAASDLYSRR
jgi:glycine cleavage system H lipoate-binding protein